MRALQLVDEPSDKIAFREIDEPEIGPGEVLVQVKAAALNHRDQWCREGKYPGIKYNTILGSDGAGLVIAIGEGVDPGWINTAVIINPNINWGSNPLSQAGDYHILGMPTDGTFAEYVKVSADRLVEKPAHLNYSEAAALPLGGLTAFRALVKKGELQADQTVLITGIGGGVSQMAFMFAKAIGSHIYVTSGSEEKLAEAISSGAAGAFNYKKDWAKESLKASGGFDVIVDSAGGDQLNNYIRIIKPGGKIVMYGSTAGKPQSLDTFKLFWSQASIIGSTMGNDQEFEEMVAFVNKHQLKPKIDSIRPFDQIISCFDEMKAGKQNGKLVIEF